MSVQGPTSFPLRPFAPPALAGTAAPRARTAAAAASQPDQAPPESSLWELLTEEERSFFSQQASMGALTYGRGRAASAPAASGSAPIGQRLDVRG